MIESARRVGSLKGKLLNTFAISQKQYTNVTVLMLPTGTSNQKTSCWKVTQRCSTIVYLYLNHEHHIQENFCPQFIYIAPFTLFWLWVNLKRGLLKSASFLPFDHNVVNMDFKIEWNLLQPWLDEKIALYTVENYTATFCFRVKKNVFSFNIKLRNYGAIYIRLILYSFKDVWRI